MTCPICEKRISNWEMAGGKTVIVAGEHVHLACIKVLMQKK